MKHILKILALLVAISAFWIGLLQASVIPESYAWLLPLYFIVSLGCYGLLMVGVGLMQFPTCPQEALLLHQAYLQFLLGPGTKMLFEFVKEMPKPETELRLDFSSVHGPPFFTWVIIQLFPVVLSSLVYEKQQRLRIMMKMQGLGDGPYWMISYAYFLLLSAIYMLVLVIFGIGWKILNTI
ncbi:hypothetical protein ACH5RR_002769 [Cinchona calisaya]|uniref:Dolichol-phosphate mannosyltransferase subunit 3 n=1 Tax=Cinchona calisaya TaxID=153742 RepID=A0ABD3ASX3_9GENT